MKLDLMKRIGLSAFCLLFTGLAGAQPTPTGGYQVLQKVPLDGDSGWDYLLCDSGARRLYVDHGDRLQVLDADSLQVVGTVPGLKKCHGVALAKDLGKGYVTDGDAGEVVVFDLKTLKVISHIKAQADADCVVYDPATQRVFAFDGDSGKVTVVDATLDQVIATLSLGGKLEFAAVDGQGCLYNNLEDQSLVLRINTKTLQIEKRWGLNGVTKPSSMAIDVEHKRLFIGCRDKMLAVLDTADGHMIQSLPIGDHVDATTFDAGSQTVLSTCGDGTLSVIEQDSPFQYHVVENAVTEPGARTVAFDSRTGHVFSVTAQLQPAAAPTNANPNPKPQPVPGTFHLLVLGR